MRSQPSAVKAAALSVPAVEVAGERGRRPRPGSRRRRRGRARRSGRRRAGAAGLRSPGVAAASSAGSAVTPEPASVRPYVATTGQPAADARSTSVRRDGRPADEDGTQAGGGGAPAAASSRRASWVGTSDTWLGGGSPAPQRPEDRGRIVGGGDRERDPGAQRAPGDAEAGDVGQAEAEEPARRRRERVGPRRGAGGERAVGEEGGLRTAGRARGEHRDGRRRPGRGPRRAARRPRPGRPARSDRRRAPRARRRGRRAAASRTSRAGVTSATARPISRRVRRVPSGTATAPARRMPTRIAIASADGSASRTTRSPGRTPDA